MCFFSDFVLLLIKFSWLLKKGYAVGRNYFKTVGVFPFVSGIGREALQVAEQEAGKQYLDGLVRYAPLMKTAALSSSILFHSEYE